MMEQSLRAWRTRMETAFADGRSLRVERPRDTASATHCAELMVHVRGRALDAAVATRGLGELLRVLALATAPHVDPAVLNVLWGDDDGLCAMDTALCVRCDAVDRRHGTPVVQLSVQGEHSTRSGIGILHDAIYNWNEETDGSDEYAQLCEALNAAAMDDAHRVELVVLVGLFPSDDAALDVRDLKALLARRSESGRFQLTRVLPQRFAAVVTSPQYKSLFTTIADAGISTSLIPLHPSPRAGDPDPWQWLYEWTARSPAAQVPVHTMGIVYNSVLPGDTLPRLLDFVATKSVGLEQLTLHWPFQSIRVEPAQRRRGLEAVGAALFAPRARIRLQTLDLDLGELTSQDVDALRHGAARVVESGDHDSAAGLILNAVEWKPQNTTERVIRQVVALFASTGVRDLDLNVGQRGLSCSTLKQVLQSCPELTTLTWRILDYGDFSELSDAAWPRDGRSSQLRVLRVSFMDGNDENAITAMDSLMERVGPTLTSLDLWALRRPLSGAIANVLAMHCPQLRHLEVGNANAAFYEQLGHAWDDGRCSISSLTAHTGVEPNGTEWMVLLVALKDLRRRVSRTLRQIILNARRGQSEGLKPVGRAFLAALEANPALRRAAFHGDLSAALQTQLQALSPFASRPVSLRRRVALLSVNEHRDSRLVLLPRGVLASILEFAGRPTRRYAYR